MQSKLQEITEKIYNEGVAKGNADAEQIISSAKKDAEGIIAKAKADAEDIIANAKKASQELKVNTENEIGLSAKQAVNSLKQAVTDLINNQLASEAVSKVTNDKAFMQGVIETMLKTWATGGAQSMDIDLLLPAGDKENLESYFKKSAKDILDKGLDIKPSDTLKSGFQIVSKDGGYKVSFTDEDFANFFKQYLRPKLIELLFS